MANINLPVPANNSNKLNTLQLANLVSMKLSDQPASSTSSPSKALIIDTLNEAQRMFAVRSDTWTWLNKTTALVGFDYNSTPVAHSNISLASINNNILTYDNAGSPDFYVAQPFTGGDSSSNMTSISIVLTKPAGATTAVFQAMVVSDISGSPNILDIKANSTPVVLTGPNTTETITFAFLDTFMPTVGTQYWVIIKSTGSDYTIAYRGYVSRTIPLTTPNPMNTADPIGSGWTSLPGANISLYFGYSMIPKNYKYQFEAPSDVQTPQRMYIPPTAIPAVYVLLPLPFDTFQHSTFGNYMLGTEFFTVSGFTSTGQPKVIIPMNLKRDLWYMDYKAKVTTLIDDDDEPMFPSDYRYLLVKQATYELMLLGYGTQDAVYIASVKKDIEEGMKFMMRDYNNRGEQYVNVIGMPYTPMQQSGVKQLNDKYRGPNRLGVVVGGQ